MLVTATSLAIKEATSPFQQPLASTPHRTGRSPSLNCLQETVSPRALLNSRFISAPLVEAKIRLPASNGDLAASQKDEWNGRSFGISRNWTEMNKDEPMRAPFDSRGVVSKDPTLRWSVDF